MRDCLSASIDHLWQSTLFVVLVYGLARLTRKNLSALRLWMWRGAALKFLLPFGLLYAFGAWLGFPVRHSAIPPPAAIADFAALGLPVATPAQTFASNAWWLAMGLMLALTGAAACGVGIIRELRSAGLQHDSEQALTAADWTHRATPLGFLRAAVLTGAAVLLLFVPMVCGAIKDRQWRQQVLVIDQRSLLSAMVAMSEAKPGRGFASRVTTDHHGVSILNINIQDLVALVYGIDQFEVFGGALPWLESPRYDVRVAGPVYAPSAFDPYSLRKPVTDYLYQRFGVSIRVNGDCQDPCGDHQSFHIERLR